MHFFFQTVKRWHMRRVLLCGKSLYMSGLQASLKAVPDLELQSVDAQPEQILELITAWQPQVLILEAGLLKSAFSLALLENYPHLKLIGLEIEDNRMLVFSGSSSYQPTPEQLLQVINA
jgi:hypothetical protein